MITALRRCLLATAMALLAEWVQSTYILTKQLHHSPCCQHLVCCSRWRRDCPGSGLDVKSLLKDHACICVSVRPGSAFSQPNFRQDTHLQCGHGSLCAAAGGGSQRRQGARPCHGHAPCQHLCQRCQRLRAQPAHLAVLAAECGGQRGDQPCQYGLLLSHLHMGQPGMGRLSVQQQMRCCATSQVHAECQQGTRQLAAQGQQQLQECKRASSPT